MRKDFTVLIPVYNTDPAHLLEALNSIANQTIDRNYKILIIDDGSTLYNTKEILEYVQKNKFGYKNVEVYYCGENGGTSSALNKGHELIDTEYVAIMGSDDICDKHRFELQMKYIEMRNDVDVLGANLYSFYNEDLRRSPIYTSKHKEFPTLKDSPYGWIVNHGTVIYKNEIVKKIGGYDIKCKRGQDVNLWMRLSNEGKLFANLPQVLYAWRRFNKNG